MTHRLPAAGAIAALGLLAACDRDDTPSKVLDVTVLRDGKPAAAMLFTHPLDVTCRLQVNTGAKPNACTFTIRQGQMVYGPYLPLPRGAYRVHFQVETAPGCPGGPVNFEAVAGASTVETLGIRSTPISASGDQTLNFDVDETNADSAPLQFRTSIDAEGVGCVVLRRVVVQPR